MVGALRSDPGPGDQRGVPEAGRPSGRWSPTSRPRGSPGRTPPPAEPGRGSPRPACGLTTPGGSRSTDPGRRGRRGPGRLRVAGLAIEAGNRDLRMVQGWVPVADLEALATLPAGGAGAAASYGRTRAGAVTSRGRRHPPLRPGSGRGLTGAGIKVGVISTAWTAWRRPLRPGSCRRRAGPGGRQRRRGHRHAGDRPRLRPRRRPALRPAGTSLEFIDATNALRDAGAQVIVDDIGHITSRSSPMARWPEQPGRGDPAGGRLGGRQRRPGPLPGVFVEGPFDAEIPGTATTSVAATRGSGCCSTGRPP